MNEVRTPGRRPVASRRVAGAAAADVGVLAAAWPLRGLVEATAWLGPTIVVTLLVVLVGVAGRPRLHPIAVVALQAVVAVGGPVWWWCSGTMIARLIPTPATFFRAGELLGQAGEVLVTSTPPVPPAPGVGFLVTLAVAAVAWSTDALAVTWSRPLVAGLPLLVPYLTAVANNAGELPWATFAVLALAWTALLLLCGPRPLVETADQTGRVRPRRLAVGVLASVAALALALGAGALVPTMPVRYLADGFGRGGLGGPGAVGYSPEADMLASLRDTNTDPVLTYTTDDPAAPPLRVGVTSDYTAGRWSPSAPDAQVSSSPTLPRPAGLRDVTSVTSHTVTVGENRLAAPHLAAPERVTQGTVAGARWAMDADGGVLLVDETPERYRMTYLSIAPTPGELDGTSLPEGASERRAVLDALDTREVTPTIRAIAGQVTRGTATPHEKAVALQSYFRTGDFQYSLELPEPPAGMSEQEAGRSAVDRFLADRRGYCVQFTTAFVLMARAAGVPARMATGFLPGQVRGDGSRQVLQSDAHAWPEVWIQGIGWLRFEPTPLSRAGTAPAWSTTPEEAAPTAAPTASASPTPSASTPSAAPSGRPDVEAGADDTAGTEEDAPSALPWVLGICAGALALVALVGAAPWAARRRRHRRRVGDDPREVAEARWADLMARFADLGLPLDPALGLEAQASRIATETLLDTDDTAAMQRLAATVHAARYLPGDPPPWPEDDEQRVLRAVRDARAWPNRVRAALLPSDGVDELRRRLPGRERARDEMARR